MRVGNVIIAVGIVVAAIGLVVRFAPGLVSWFGKLPGDVRIETESTRVLIPITSMLLVSLFASIVITVFNRVRG